MSERSTGATDSQIERAVRKRITQDFPNIIENELRAWIAAGIMTADSGLVTITDAAGLLVTTEERIVSVSDLRLLIGGLSTEELESGEFPKLSAAANRVWKLIRDGEEAAIGDAP